MMMMNHDFDNDDDDDGDDDDDDDDDDDGPGEEPAHGGVHRVRGGGQRRGPGSPVNLLQRHHTAP